MKTKTKIVAFLEIAVVLCSLFLVAIPAITAEQNQELQKVSASMITTASEDDYVLSIYGNANKDDTIDMGDVVYTKLAIFGKKPKTELCDAKYDGRINVLDVIQTKLIILGKEKELTFEDESDEAVTVHKPINRIVVITQVTADPLRALNAKDKVVGVGNQIRLNRLYFPELSTLPGVGDFRFDYEAVLTLHPDVLILWKAGMRAKEAKKKLPGITVIAMDLSNPVLISEEITKLGYILDKEEEAKELTDWYKGNLNAIKDKTDELSEDKKPRVYEGLSIDLYRTMSKSKSTKAKYNRYHTMLTIAGGINVAGDLPGWAPKVDPEWVVEQNPDIIIKSCPYPCVDPTIPNGYGTDDPSGMAAHLEDILNRPELANVNAVKDKKVYTIAESDLSRGQITIVLCAYEAKFFHPELFKDLDPEAIHQEYLTRFLHLDYELDEHGVFIYPPIITGEGKLAGIPDRYYDSIVAQP